jgi:hypothetical protein
VNIVLKAILRLLGIGKSITATAEPMIALTETEIILLKTAVQIATEIKNPADYAKLKLKALASKTRYEQSTRGYYPQGVNGERGKEFKDIPIVHEYFIYDNAVHIVEKNFNEVIKEENENDNDPQLYEF